MVQMKNVFQLKSSIKDATDRWHHSEIHLGRGCGSGGFAERKKVVLLILKEYKQVHSDA